MKIFFKKFNKEKIKEVSLVSLAIILIGIGYINFANKEDLKIETYAKTTNNLGDVELVSTNAVLVENDKTVNNTISNIIENKIDNTNIENKDNLINNEIKETSSDIFKEYFSEIKLNREIMYDEILETYQKMIDSTSISSEQKSIAMKEIEIITKQKSSISVAEELIKLKGFEDVVILINEENINVIIRIAHLTKAQVVQIQNIVMKELNVNVENISISTK